MSESLISILFDIYLEVEVLIYGNSVFNVLRDSHTSPCVNYPRGMVVL